MTIFYQDVIQLCSYSRNTHYFDITMNESKRVDVLDSLSDLQDVFLLLLVAQLRTMCLLPLRRQCSQCAISKFCYHNRIALRVCRHSIELQTVGMIQSLLDVDLPIEISLLLWPHMAFPDLHGHWDVSVESTLESMHHCYPFLTTAKDPAPSVSSVSVMSSHRMLGLNATGQASSKAIHLEVIHSIHAYGATSTGIGFSGSSVSSVAFST